MLNSSRRDENEGTYRKGKRGMRVRYKYVTPDLSYYGEGGLIVVRGY